MVSHSPAEPVFHHRWEAVARALLAVVAGAVEASGGEFRHSIERMEPGHYLTSSYYEHWLTAAATLAVEHGLVTGSELEAHAGGRFPLSGPVTASVVCGCTLTSGTATWSHHEQQRAPSGSGVAG